MSALEIPVNFLDKVSVFCAYLSVSFWLFAQLPQVIKNYTDKSVDGLSLAFLLCWFSGDFLNLVSCLLNDAMMFQILLSFYYCIIDIILASQYYYYKKMYYNPESKWYHRRHRPHQHHNHHHYHHHQLHHYRQSPTFAPTKSPRSSLIANLNNNYGSIDDKFKTNHTPRKVQGIFGRNGIAVAAATLVGGVPKANGAPIEEIPYDNSTFFQLINMIQAFTIIITANIGKSLAWSCTFLYLVSRFPQIYTNYKLKSTAGISLKLVCFALCGNLFYSLSLILSHDSTTGGEVSRNFWRAELSYFIGAIGTVVSDIFVIFQWYLYDRHRITSSCSGRLRPRSAVTTPRVTDGATKTTTTNTTNTANTTIVLPRTINTTISPGQATRADVAESVKSTLSPSHLKKLNESTPLSPIDFLMDTYVPINSEGLKQQLQQVQQQVQPSSHTTSRRSSVLREDSLFYHEQHQQ